MKLDKETIDRIANLARLEIAEEETQGLLHDMNNILGFMQKLDEVDTTGVEPLVYLTDEVNAEREDVLKAEMPVEEALRNAPLQDGKYFKVAKVIIR